MGYPLPSRGEWVPVSFHVAEDSRLYRRLLWGDLLADGTELLFGCFIVLSSITVDSFIDTSFNDVDLFNVFLCINNSRYNLSYGNTANE